MTSAQARDIQRDAAQAALAEPGVAALQPTLADRLAAATAAIRPTERSTHLPAAVRVERLTATPGWRVEVRCMLHPGHRALDVARRVRERVRTTLTSNPTRQVDRIIVQVTVTATATRGRASA
ncbi:hypothetical protein ACFC1R_36025 [Kitasatospora sp. NPDC056138]|uniref:hypothetical protein n=1 Tax=Kitasatospora sp. NPDC056138 TaxID=3345724 RepID=UPI0035D81ADD